MERLLVNGGGRLRGEVTVGGAKNAVLPLMAAAFMVDGEVILKNVPRLSDVEAMAGILDDLNVEVLWEKEYMRLRADDAVYGDISAERMGTMRASNLMWGPLLDRFGRAVLARAGGCRIGRRPMDQHIAALRGLGVSVESDGDVIVSTGEKRRGAVLKLKRPSVGATENAVMAAVRAEGRTVIANAAAEPEIVDLCSFLRRCGGRIAGDGTGTIVIDGVKRLKGCEYTVMADRIVGGTYLLAAVACGGDVTLTNVGSDLLGSVAERIAATGAVVRATGSTLRVQRSGSFCGVDIATAPYPGFPTDLQPPFTAAMTVADGAAVIDEAVFEDRLGFCDELRKFGADVAVNGGIAHLRGVAALHGATVAATDLRGAAALLIAALAADGESCLTGVEYLDRGYADVEEALGRLGADVRREAAE